MLRGSGACHRSLLGQCPQAQSQPLGSPVTKAPRAFGAVSSRFASSSELDLSACLGVKEWLDWSVFRATFPAGSWRVARDCIWSPWAGNEMSAWTYQVKTSEWREGAGLPAFGILAPLLSLLAQCFWTWNHVYESC